MRLSKGAGGVSIGWGSAPTVISHSAFRGSFSTLAPAGSVYNHSTSLACRTAAASVSDLDPLGPGQGAYHLVLASNACGDGSLGTRTGGAARPVLVACP